MIRLFLDDTRPTPEGWTLARTVTEAKELLQNNTVSAISLDHDLENEDGMQLVDWMLRSNNVPAEIIIHSWNQIGIMRMQTVLERHGHIVRVERSQLHP